MDKPIPTVREATFDLLRQLGVSKVFGNPGSTELPFLTNWPADFDYVLGLQEASVIGMADGYARASGGPAFVSLHSAGGVGHSLGNVFSAFKNQTPMVILAGQQTRSLLSNLPFLGATDAARFPEPYVKWSIEPARAEDVPAAIARAFHIAMQRPYGPTFVSVPADDWGAPCRPVSLRDFASDFAPDPALIAELGKAIAVARRPALVVGAEVDGENAGPAMVELAERMRAEVWTAPFASRVAFPEEHPLFAGFLDAAPTAVTAALEPYDLILVVGAPVFTFHVAGDCGLFHSDVPIFQLTTNREAAASAPVGRPILGSLRLALPALTAALSDTDRAIPPRRACAPQPVASDPIDAAYVLRTLRDVMQDDAILVEEAPSHRPALHLHLPIRDWGGFFTMASGCLGYSLPGSVGVALAKPGRRIVCLIGDGSMMYSPQALWTAVQRRLPICVVVLNNGGYGAMRSFGLVMQTRNVPGIDLPGLDFVSLARAMGCPGKRVTRAADVPAALESACRADGPSLVEVIVDTAIPVLYDET